MSQRKIEDNLNERGRRILLKRVETRRQQPQVSPRLLEKAMAAEEESSDQSIGADQLAILFVCQQGWQTLFDILRGVNATRVPIGKEPLSEEEVLPILEELERAEYLKQIEIRGRSAWAATTKGREIET